MITINIFDLDPVWHKISNKFRHDLDTKKINNKVLTRSMLQIRTRVWFRVGREIYFNINDEI